MASRSSSSSSTIYNYDDDMIVCASEEHQPVEMEVQVQKNEILSDEQPSCVVDPVTTTTQVPPHSSGIVSMPQDSSHSDHHARYDEEHSSLSDMTSISETSRCGPSREMTTETRGDDSLPCRPSARHISFSFPSTGAPAAPMELQTPNGPMNPTTTTLSTSTKLAAPDSKYPSYNLMVDRTQDDKAVEIALFTASRPHMRAFHFAWLSFFVAFFNWFAIAPLLSEVQKSLKLSKEEIWTSSILAVAGTAVVRATIGPYCDKYGSRVCIVLTLVVSGIPTMALGLVRGGLGLSLCRLVIGVAGGTFVTGQYWTSSMFTREVAGTANALVAGWGNLGGGVTLVVMGSVLFPLFKLFYPHEMWGMPPEEWAWRTVMIIPAMMSIITAYYIFRYSDDCPKGNYQKRVREGQMDEVSTTEAIKACLKDFNTWLLFIQYACCFGVEITMTNAAALYFKAEFNLTTEKAAAIASVFGWMNLFARGLGGFISDIANVWKGMQGRLAWHFITLFMEGVMVIIFAMTKTLGGAISVMCIFSIFVQAAEGSTYGIVPYVKPPITGSIAGLVGAGGTVGGVIFSILFRQYAYRQAFKMMGYSIIASSILTGVIFIRGHKGCICGKDADEIQERVRRNQSFNEGVETELQEMHHQKEMVCVPIGTDEEEEKRDGVVTPPRETPRKCKNCQRIQDKKDFQECRPSSSHTTLLTDSTGQQYTTSPRNTEHLGYNLEYTPGGCNDETLPHKDKKESQKVKVIISCNYSSTEQNWVEEGDYYTQGGEDFCGAGQVTSENGVIFKSKSDTVTSDNNTSSGTAAIRV